MSNATTTKQFSNDSGAVPIYIEKRLNRGYLPKKRFVIVKYRPVYYDSGKYLHNEWSSYSDIGRSFDDGVLSFEEYLMIEKRFISCIKSLAYASSCKYLTIGYLERRKRIKIKKSAGEWRYISQGSKIQVKDLDDILKRVIREQVWMVFINKSRQFMVDFGYDMYLHIRCPLDKGLVNTIVNDNKLFLITQ